LSRSVLAGEIQGGAVNRGRNWFFLKYRPSCLIEAYGRLEKYWLVWAGCLANHLFNFTFIFLSDGLTAAVERTAGPPDLFSTAASQSHSAATDGRRTAKLA
jgi:hypothetical protein